MSAAVARGSKIGIHALQRKNIFDHLRAARARGVRFPVVKAVDSLDWLGEVKQFDGRSLTLARITQPDEGLQHIERETNLARRVEQLFAPLVDRLQANPTLRRAVDYWEICNEPDPPHDPPAQPGYTRLGELMIACMERAEALGVKLGILALNAGTPEWQEMVDLAQTGVFGRAKRGGHIVTLHEGVFGRLGSAERSAPIDLWWGERIPGAPAVPGAGALCFRYRYLYHILQQRNEVVPLVISETYYGGGFAHDGASLDDIVARVRWYDEQAARDPYLLAHLPFTLGTYDGDHEWSRSDYDFAYPALIQYMAAVKDRPHPVADSPSPASPRTEPVRPVSTPATAANLLVNGSFEDGWYHPDGVPELQIPNGWGFWYAPADAPNPHDPHPWQRPEVRTLPASQLPPHERPIFISDGAYCVKIFKANWYARFTQSLALNGAFTWRTPLFASLVKGYRPDGSKIWADDPGGRDGLVRYVIGGVASPWQSLIAGRRNELAYTFTAQGPVQLAVEFMCPFPLSDTSLFLDGWSLTAEGEAPPPADGDGIVRVCNLLPQDATAAEYWLVAQTTYARRQTIGFSADDAGELVHAGASAGRVIAWAPERIGGGLTQAWFNTHYPGATLMRMWFGAPSAPPAPDALPTAPRGPLPPRPAFRRVYNLLPQDATLNEYWLVAQQTYATRETIGFSADDAGFLAQHGDPTSRVVAWSPQRIGTGLTQAWFDAHYPGAVMVVRELGQ